MNIAMVGSGYVGLVTGVCLADFGHRVICLDRDPTRIEALRRGEIPIYEPGLDDLVRYNTEAGRLSFSTDIATAVRECDAVFIAVGTPSQHGVGHADLTYVYAAAREIAGSLEGFTVIVTKSTVPVGTGDEVEKIIREENPKADIAVVSNPEFLREGAAIDDFKRPDRIVVGLEDDRARTVMSELYRPLSLNQAPLLFTSRRTAELVKYASNAFLAMKITFINEVADLCEKSGADIQDVSRGIGLDSRIGAKFLDAGPGYGGSCFPKDTLALVKTAQEFGAGMRLVETTIAINDERKLAMVRKIVDAMGGDVRGKVVGLLGLAFKPNTDDMRDSPAIDIVRGLVDAGATVRGYDPKAMDYARRIMSGIELVAGEYEVAESADALVIVTEWNQFRALDLSRIRALMNDPVMIDLRNIYRRDEVVRHGIRYSSIGHRD
ncbi:UDP-glucose dehydrogenase family protein [Rhizobium alvei]|uniref:UDP-glucose 6-dehydrogenase n=1 Tax=Rhizobium alvei TaxID=1132659 RepID=A0ABT8YSJ0_9HYPH|nr:UDP-glucose/GDP-mannose dehydrogenase family protein [Rhizobium alvei]MDO6966733.1 UDP-glucose/GDP-mannose dehydrogenase family protein [Rhizobium alvei]